MLRLSDDVEGDGAEVGVVAAGVGAGVVTGVAVVFDAVEVWAAVGVVVVVG